MHLFSYDHSKYRTCYTHNAHVLQVKQRKRRLQYHHSRRLDKYSFLHPAQFFPITCSSLENEWDSWTDGTVGGRALFLNWRPQLNSPFLILLYVWSPFLPEWEKSLALNSKKKKKKGLPNP